MFARGKKTNYALELTVKLKAFFHYCIAHCSSFIPVTPTACKVTQLWTNSVYNVSPTVTTQQQFHLSQCVFQTVLSDLTVSCLENQCYQNMCCSVYCLCWLCCSVYCLCCSMYCLCWLCCSMYCLCWLCCSVYCLCCSMHCLCVNVYCNTASGCQPNCS